MAKKTLALALFVLVACSLGAAKLVSGVETVPSFSFGSMGDSFSFSLNNETGIRLCFEKEGRAVFGVSIGAVKAHSILNLDTFSSAGDYCGLSLKLFKSMVSNLEIEAGFQLLIPQSHAGSLIPTFTAGVSFRREAALGENFVLSMGPVASVALGRSFASYRLGFCVMGLWRQR